MSLLKKGDIVSTHSYGRDVLFRITDIEDSISGKKLFTLIGVIERVFCHSFESDLNLVKSFNEDDGINKNYGNINKDKIGHYIQKLNPFNSISQFSRSPLPIKVLHLDSVEEFSQMSKKYYEDAGLQADIRVITESKMPQEVSGLLKEVNPDILIMTGHDSLLKGSDDLFSMSSYRNSKYFIEAVYEARQFEKDTNNLVIIAGSCQSYYEKLISVGANFASSPKRILINAMDPALVCEKIALTKSNKVVSPEEIAQITISGSSGIGGIPTRGKKKKP